jgi:hypothetical protein
MCSSQHHIVDARILAFLEKSGGEQAGIPQRSVA